MEFLIALIILHCRVTFCVPRKKEQKPEICLIAWLSHKLIAHSSGEIAKSDIDFLLTLSDFLILIEGTESSLKSLSTSSSHKIEGDSVPCAAELANLFYSNPSIREDGSKVFFHCFTTAATINLIKEIAHGAAVAINDRKAIA